jgi:hypothetical protein
VPSFVWENCPPAGFVLDSEVVISSREFTQRLRASNTTGSLPSTRFRSGLDGLPGTVAHFGPEILFNLAIEMLEENRTG